MKNNKFYRLLAAGLISTTVLSAGPVATFAGAPVVAQAASTMDTATEIDLFSGFETTVSKGEVQYYKFYNTTGTAIDLTIGSNDNHIDADVSIMKKINGIYVNVRGYKYKKGSNPEAYYYCLEADKNPYILVVKGSEDEDSETLGITATKLEDPSASLKSGKKVKTGELVSSRIYTKDDRDCYKFNSGKYNLIKIQATSGNWASNIYSVYKNTSGASSSVVGSWNYNSLSSETQTSDYIRLEKNTDYYIDAKLWNGDPEEYSFKILGYVDVENQEKKASVVKMGKSVAGQLEVKDDVDYYKFKATKSGKVKLTASAEEAFFKDVTMDIYKKGSASKLVTTEVKKTATKASFKVKKNKWYVVRITGAAKKAYTFKIK
ncbi:hypothetical protein SAMN02910400_00693 [Lachnospiraceae bacterium C10]|nr:hypothetical protein SAMN02910400_00693 [Lachnospiraceae bacterium C10]